MRERRDDERRRHPAQQPPLDLSGAAWHHPPHPEVVNAATFALRRAVNDYPDDGPLRAAIAVSHDIDPARVVVGHGAGELLRAALHALAGEEVAVGWPGWGPLPGLVTEAGATPMPVALEALVGGAARPEGTAGGGAAPTEGARGAPRPADTAGGGSQAPQPGGLRAAPPRWSSRGRRTRPASSCRSPTCARWRASTG